MVEHYAFAVFATILAGLVRTSVGVGSGIALTASLSLIFAPRLTLAIMAFLQIGLGVSAVYHYWGRWDAALVRKLIGWVCLGVLAGSWLVSVVPQKSARHVLGAALAVVALVELLRRGGAGRWMERVPAGISGLASGVAGATANACGAVASMYLKSHGMTHEAFLATLAILVLIHDVFRLGVFWQFDILSRQAFYVALLLLPFAFLGGWLGTRVRAAASERLLGDAVFVLIFVIGVLLLT